MNNINVMNHPLIQHKLTLIRDKTTGVKEFREAINEISMLLCYEATRDLPLKEIEIETPISIAKSNVISGKKMAIIPILRAGIGMIDGMLSLIPAAKVGHIGVFRDPDTLKPVEYYSKLPTDIKNRDVIIVDPMLATGGSVSMVIDKLKASGVKNIKFLCILASPEGVACLEKNHSDVEIYCGAIDNGLNEEGFIIPGLGDAGDRLFGTK